MQFDASRVMAMRESIIDQNSALQRASGRGSIAGQLQPGDGASADFTSALQSALGEVNGMSRNAQSITEAYERGEVTDIAAVMLARQQASIGFETTLQVRNKLLSAYKDIMGMPV